MKKTYTGSCHCGAQPIGHGDIPKIGGVFRSVTIACLHDHWWNPPAVTACLQAC